ncbi:MAG: DUF5686 family protein, partial [Bacteroidia bacterium]
VAYNKIEVIPKRKGDPAFTGILYIQENSWRITGVNLYLTKENKINFVDTIRVTQVFKPVSGDSIWMPASSGMAFTFNIFGFNGSGYFNSVLSDYIINPELEPDFFKRNIVSIEKGANEKDSAYWAENRPVPLTEEEKKDYHKKDSIAKIVEDPKYIDSIDARNNRFKLSDILNGYTYRKRNKKIEWKIPGIMDAGIQYNTVEGINASVDFNFTKSYEDFRRINFTGKLRYGFSNQLPGAEIQYQYLFDRNRFEAFGFKARSIVMQYNSKDPISPLINSIYTLFLNDNYMKTFRESAIGGFYRTELTPGINFRTELNFIERQPLVNTTDLLLRDDPEKLFTSNDPLHVNTEDSLFTTNDALIADVQFRIRFKQKYHTVAGTRYYAENKWPRLSVFYRKAIRVNTISSDFDLLGLTIRDDIELKLFGQFMYVIKGGYYARLKKIYYMDYSHFNGNQTIISTSDYLNAFKLLPYYGVSTKNWYGEFHSEHHFNGFLINKIPLMRKLFLQEIVGFSALVNDKVDNYFEVNAGIKNIFRILRVDYVWSFRNGKPLNNGFMIGINTNF